MGAKPSSIGNTPQAEEPPDADVYDEDTMSRFNSEAAESVKNRIKLGAKVGLALKRGSVHMESMPSGLVAPPPKPVELPKNPSARRGLGLSAHALASGATVLRDAPRNVFGPGHTFGPDVYGSVHAGDPHYSWLLELGKLQDVEKVACLETFIYFQGKMGVLLRECDTFSQIRDVDGLWVKLQAIISNLLGVPCMRVWQFDPTSRSIICIYNNGRNAAMVGRGMPTLGSMPGDVARAKKVLVCNNCKDDSRFDGWQFKEMQATQDEPLGSCISAPLLSGEKDENGKDKPPDVVIEAYSSDPEMVFDGSDIFLLTTLMSYAGPSYEAIKLQWQQRQVAKLPVMLLTHESLGGFIEACREMLRVACNAEDCEIFIVDEENTKSAKPEDLLLYVAEDRAKSAELDVIMKKAEELGKIM